jgi:hypothetical protein
MPKVPLALIAFAFLAGCGRHYHVVGESDTSKPIAVSIMKSPEGGAPTRLYYTELTGNDTEFVWDHHINDKDAYIEAWFELRDRPGKRTVYAIPPDKKVRLKLDRKDDGVVVEETRIDGNKHAK